MEQLDLNKLADEHDNSVQKSLVDLMKPVASALRRLQGHVSDIGVDEAERRLKFAQNAIQGRDPLSQAIARGDRIEQGFLDQVLVTGEVTAQQYNWLVEKYNQSQLVAPPQETPQVEAPRADSPKEVEGTVVTDAHMKLGEAVTELAKAEVALVQLDKEIEEAESKVREIFEKTDKGLIAKVKGADLKGQAETWLGKLDPKLHVRRTELIKEVADATDKVKAAATALGAPVGS